MFFRHGILQKLFLCDEFKLHSKVGFFESRKDMAVFILKVILNVQKYFIQFCKCDGEAIYLQCEIANMFNSETTYEIYKNCLNLDFLLKVKQNLHLKLCELQEKHNHFLCKITINEKYHYSIKSVFINEKYHYSIKSVFTGEDIFFDVKKALTEWEETKTEETCRGKVSVIVENYFKENRFFKIS